MFLLSCESDGSFCIVEKKDIIHDKDVGLKPNDKVKFYWKSVQYQGYVVMESGM